MKTKKSKPKQRTNWKQRALAIDEAYEVLSLAHASLLSIHNGLCKHHAELLDALSVKSPDPKDDPKPAPTHWQRFKSWLSGWKVELLIVMLILGFLAGLVAFVYWPR